MKFVTLFALITFTLSGVAVANGGETATECSKMAEKDSRSNPKANLHLVKSKSNKAVSGAVSQ